MTISRKILKLPYTPIRIVDAKHSFVTFHCDSEIFCIHCIHSFLESKYLLINLLLATAMPE